jgi:hypothetical protein
MPSLVGSMCGQLGKLKIPQQPISMTSQSRLAEVGRSNEEATCRLGLPRRHLVDPGIARANLLQLPGLFGINRLFGFSRKRAFIFTEIHKGRPTPRLVGIGPAA